MLVDTAMCKTKMQTDELLDMILSVSYKQIQARGNNLRLQALLKSTHQFLDRELKEKQQSRKRKWDEIKTDLAKRSKIAADDDVEMVDDELLGLGDFFNNLKSVAYSTNENC